MKKGRRITKWFVLALTLFVASVILGRTHNQDVRSVTFSKDIAPILYQHCVECHRPGGIAPMSLLTYRDAQPFAGLLREKITKREMPPWHADPRFGEFINERRLSQEEISRIVAWLDQGAKEGDARDLPRLPQFPEQWQIRQPDIVFTMTKSYALGPEAADKYLYFRIPTNFREDKWVQAVEFRPGNRKVVHHAVVFIETPENFAEAQRRNPSEKPGNAAWTLLETQPSSLELMDGTTRRVKPDVPVVDDGCSASDVDAVGFGSNNAVLSVYAPGRGIDSWPEGTAKKIPAGSNLILQMHYSKLAGRPEKDLTGVALTFSKMPVTKIVTSRSISNVMFLIPPHTDNHKVTACWNLQRDVEFIGFMPHMHVRGKSMKYELVYPDGRRQTLLSVPHYDFHWQTLYSLKTPLAVSGGSKLAVTAYYDNSERNMHNPDPSKAIRHGTATFDEMMVGFVDYIVPKPHDRVVAKIDPGIYDAYVGQYEVAPKSVLNIIRVGDRLYAEADGQRVELYPITETIFFSNKTESELTFLKNGKGEVTGFLVTRDDKLVRVKKIK